MELQQLLRIIWLKDYWHEVERWSRKAEAMVPGDVMETPYQSWTAYLVFSIWEGNQFLWSYYYIVKNLYAAESNLQQYMRVYLSSHTQGSLFQTAVP